MTIKTEKYKKTVGLRIHNQCSVVESGMLCKYILDFRHV